MIEFAVEQAESRINALSYELARCERSADVDSVHDLRVATRRLDSCLQSFGQFFPKKLKKKRKRLRGIRKLAGPVRDVDITQELLSKTGLSVENSLAQSLLKKRSKDSRELQTAIKGWKRGFSERLRDGLRNGQWKKGRPPKAGKKGRRLRLDGERSPADNAAAVLPVLAKRFFRAGRKAQDSSVNADALHSFRIRVKRLRYTLELFRPCYGPGLETRVSHLKRLQDHLGRMNDCQTALSLLKDPKWVGLDPAGDDQLRGFLEALQAEEVQRFRDYWREHFDKQERDRWIRYLSRPSHKRRLPA